MKNPLTPGGIEPATFRFVAQHLNHCATAVPLVCTITGNKSKLHTEYIRNHYYGYPLLLHQHNSKYLTIQTQAVKSFKAQWLLFLQPGLTFTNSTFCPHSIFMRFVWISEQTAIISLYSINWLGFITEECLLRGTK